MDKNATARLIENIAIVFYFFHLFLLDSKYFQLAIFHSHGAKSDFISWMNG